MLHVLALMAKLTSKQRWRTDALAGSLGLRYHAEARVAAQQLWGFLPLAPRSNDLTNNAHPLFYHPANRGSRPVQPICSGITNHFQPEARKDLQMHWKFTIYIYIIYIYIYIYTCVCVRAVRNGVFHETGPRNEDLTDSEQ